MGHFSTKFRYHSSTVVITTTFSDSFLVPLIHCYQSMLDVLIFSITNIAFRYAYQLFHSFRPIRAVLNSFRSNCMYCSLNVVESSSCICVVISSPTYFSGSKLIFLVQISFLLNGNGGFRWRLVVV